METAEVLKLLLTPPDKVSQMESLIDVTSFDVIKRYKEQDHMFDRIFNVTKKEHLGIVAAFFTQNAEGTQEKLMKLIDTKTIQIVDDNTIMHKEELLMNINEVNPHEMVHCIALPPAYLITLSGKPYE